MPAASNYETLRIRRVLGRVVEVEHPSLPATPKTRLTAALAAAGMAITVLDNSGFSTSHLALIRPYGTQKAEIVDISAVTGGTGITAASGVTFAHATGEEVQQIIWNSFILYGNSTNSTTGLTTIATIDIDVSENFTTYINTGTEYAFYFVRPYDSVDAVTGTNYSDGVANTTGVAQNSVQNLINQALTQSKSKFGGILDFEWCLSKLNEGMTYIRGQLKTWSSLQVFDYALGTATRGLFNVTPPTDMYDTNTPRSIFGVRVGAGTNLIYADKVEWEELLKDVTRTQIRTEGAIGATTLEIDNSYDFDDDGTVTVYSGGTAYDITYTGVTRSATAGVLTGVPASGTGSITATLVVDLNVWQRPEEGTPTWWTIYDGTIYFWPLPDSANDNMNVTADYYTSAAEVNSGADTISFQRYDALRHWLTWQLRSLKNENGTLDMKDGDFLMFQDIVKTMIFQELNGSGLKRKYRPKVYNLVGSTANNATQ